jgi:hypothetical protein
MALESLVASVWRLDGFLSVTRHPLRVDRGYSDVDVIGVRGDGVVRIAECKARGSACQVFVETDGQQWSSWWDDALTNLPRLWKQRPEWLPLPAQVTRIEYHLVGNVWFADPTAKNSAETRLAAEVKASLPHGLKGKSQAFVTSSIDLLLQAIRSVKREVVEENWGKRYGDPLLDAIRELIRYSHPVPSGGGQIGKAIKEEVQRALVGIVFGTE